jgi:hypothetical protein
MAIFDPLALGLLAQQSLTEELPLQADIPEAIIVSGERWQRGDGISRPARSSMGGKLTARCGGRT